jgi:hypothetical protein
MSNFVTPAIPANQLVNIVPGVLPAGGAELAMIGLLLTENWRVPIGSVYQFPNATAVGQFFGATSQEAALATVYFNGFTNCTQTPGALDFWQYNIAAVGAWLMGASVAGISLATLQSYDGTIDVTIDGVLQTATVNLATATSFSNAAQLIQNGLGITGEAGASATGSIGFTATGSASGTALTLSAVTGVVHPGSAATAAISGTGVGAGVYIVSQTSGTPGGAGVYVTSASTTASSATITGTSNIADITVVASGAIAVGQMVTGTDVTSDTYVAGFGTGTGQTGTYTLSQSISYVASETLTFTQPAVYYDSVSGAFVITSGTTGATSTIAAATGTLAADLMLTAAMGAVTSQGATPATEAGAMAAIIAITQNWVSFWTTWEPSDASKENFATWVNGTNGAYVYHMWTTSALNVEQGGPSAPVAFINNGNLSGVDMVYQNDNVTTLNGEKAAFAAGMIASIDWNAPDGFITFASKSQAGLLPDVVNGTVALLLAGSPALNTFGYGINFYGDYTTRNQAFIQWQRGLISGPFKWMDDYVGEIWFNNQCQVALMELLAALRRLPYVQPSYAAIELSLVGTPQNPGPVQLGLLNGVVVPGVSLSPSEILTITAGTGNSTAWQAVQTYGYYVQALDPGAQVRSQRGSPTTGVWYTNGESIQFINLTSILAQ